MDPRFFEDFLWNYEVALKGDTKINGGRPRTTPSHALAHIASCFFHVFVLT
jgi:hypothetical protein